MQLQTLLISYLLFPIASVKAQQVSKPEIELFIKNHSLAFNKNAAPILCTNLDSLILKLEKKRISYSKSTFIFYGQSISDQNLVGGSAQSIILSKHNSFIFYKIDKQAASLIIEVVDGNNYF